MTDQEPLATSVFHKLSSLLWGVAVFAVVLLAVYVSVGRMLLGNLQDYKAEVLDQLNALVPFRIEAGTLRGEWHSFTPEIVLGDLRVSLPGEGLDPMELSGGRVGLDVFDTLASRSLQFTSLQLENLELRGELTEDGRLVFPGVSGGDNPVGQWLRDFLLNIEYVTLKDNALRLTLPGGEQRSYGLNLHLARSGGAREFGAELVSTRGVRVSATGRGVGDPFKPQAFTGQLYLDIDSADLEAVGDMLPRKPALSVAGQLDSQWWLDWNRGELGVDVQLRASNAEIRPREGEWRLPLDELSLSASLVEQRNRWTVYAADVQLGRGDERVELPRLQVDSWGESVRVRASALELRPLNGLVLALGVLPEQVRSVFEILSPAGSVSNLELAISDIGRPLAGWDARANFQGVEVQSWKGAPGVTAATGYVDLSQAGGQVVLDSQRFAMDFPTVYAEPLYYDDFYGTINLSWDDESLVLHSGPVTATGVEGTATALFGLNIPFKPSDTGLEMDLMVGLANSHPIHRVKYVPAVLNLNLREWLAGAVGDGDVEEGAFIWRGSLRRDAPDLRTVQLFFNVANTALSYHPQWPPVDRVHGVVLIDDTDVSVWADSARLYDAALERLSAEAWMNEAGQMLLAVEGSLQGSASDGLKIVNESLLGELTSGAFGAWQAEGELQARLQLLLNLGDSAIPPEVSVQSRLSGVDLGIEPGGLRVQDLAGELDYSSAGGFRSRDLRGRLWGNAVSAEIRQRPLDLNDPSMAFGASAVEVSLAGQVAVEDVQNWLGLQALQLASGQARVEGEVSILPGERPRLKLGSNLQGAALDLPDPWRKSADEERSFALEMPLGGEQALLSLQLGDDLDLDLDVTAGVFNSAALGVGREAPELAPGVVRVMGQAPLVDVDQWQSFVNGYLLAPAQGAAAAAPDPGEAAADGAPGLRVQLDELYTERLLAWGRDVPDVRFSLAVDPAAWQVRAETNWMRGSYFQPGEGRAGLKLDYLDISGMGEALQGADGTAESAPRSRPLQLPEMQVVVSDLQRGGVALGSLQFTLGSDGDVIRARELEGELAGIRLAGDFPAELDWQQGAFTRLRARLEFDDFGRTLGQVGYPVFLETERGRIDLSLTWPDSPADFSLQTLEGSLTMEASSGRFLETPTGATGALKVLSILNLAEVVQRLSLSHMFESGVPFRQMGGEVNFRAGQIEVPELQVLGSSSSFSLSGLSQVADQSLDGELVATLPVANNLPWVAALAGGLPVAAGVFVVSKVFEKQVNRLSSGVYDIGGSWDEPTVTFDRIFDDAARAALAAPLDPNGPSPPGGQATLAADPDTPPGEMNPTDQQGAAIEPGVGPEPGRDSVEEPEEAPREPAS